MTKYGAIPTTVDGYRFASRAEARRYAELRLMALAGEIADLELHPRFRLVVNGQSIGAYVADFAYTDVATGRRVVEDVKGGQATRTAVYRLKRRLMLACHGIEITEVG